MSARIASAVQSLLDSPTSGNTVMLIIGVSSPTGDAAEQIEDLGGEVEEELPYRSIAVSVDESDLEALCSLEVVETVEVEKEYTTRGDTDFRSQSRSMM